MYVSTKNKSKFERERVPSSLYIIYAFTIRMILTTDYKLKPSEKKKKKMQVQCRNICIYMRVNVCGCDVSFRQLQYDCILGDMCGVKGLPYLFCP